MFTVWGLFPAPFLLTPIVAVSILGPFFVPKLRPGRAPKTAFFPHFLFAKKTACAQIRARSDRPGRSKNLYMKVALFEHVTHYKLRAHLLDNFQGAATGCGRPKPLLSASSAPSIGSPIFPGAICGAAVATQFIVCANPAELLVHHVIGWRNGSSFIYVLHPLVQSSLC